MGMILAFLLTAAILAWIVLRGKKNETKLKGPWAERVWREESRRFCVGTDEMKEIVLYSKKGNLEEIYPNFRGLGEALEERGIPVIDRTEDQSCPPICEKKPSEVIGMGEIG